MAENEAGTHSLLEVAGLAGVPPTTIYEAVRCGRIGVSVACGVPPEIVVDDDSLERYLDVRRQRARSFGVAQSRHTAVFRSEYISLAEAARRYNVNHRTLCQHATRGMLRHVSTLLGDQEHRLTTGAWMADYIASHRKELPIGYVWVSDAASVLDVTPQWVYQLAHLGVLESLRVGHRVAIASWSVSERCARSGGVEDAATRAAG